MPSVPLPENPSFEHLKSQAKDLQRQVQAYDDGSVALAKEFHPRLAGSEPTESKLAGFKRTDAQLVVARLYGFASWSKLRKHVALVEVHARPDIGDTDPSDRADEFATLASATYGKGETGERISRAQRMLSDDPGIASMSIAAIAAAGNHALLEERIADDEALIGEPTGPSRWPPLLYCSYSRIPPAEPGLSTLEAARLLLDHGADPNAGFLWRGLVPPFTALTGAFGRGEGDQPPHPNSAALARLLLEAGADPNDGQALYNNGLAGTAHDDPSHLELLIEFGLGVDQSGPWYERFGSRLTPPSELLYDELEIAAHRGLAKRMQFLVGLGLDLERGVGRSGQTPVALAARKGHTAVLEVLSAAGAQM